MANYVPIVMYCLRLFIVVLQELRDTLVETEEEEEEEPSALYVARARGF